ncbi:hypothetical protein [Flexithrix dorotheae]|uniref:hypothetical protein n=1 Tax=Flexithrix dorotheae TaxID=70993 RepID=UPI0003793036|nr:hypothetical protein [Flexithrix dorotheae]
MRNNNPIQKNKEWLQKLDFIREEYRYFIDKLTYLSSQSLDDRLNKIIFQFRNRLSYNLEKINGIETDINNQNNPNQVSEIIVEYPVCKKEFKTLLDALQVQAA